MKVNATLTTMLAGVLASCGTYTPRQVAEPSSVTLRAAIFEVATTLRDVQDLVPPNKRAGLLADEVTVVFNVAAKSTSTNGADLTVSNVALPSGTLGASLNSENVSEGSRGNQITVKFRNIATVDMTKGALSLKQFQASSNASSSRGGNREKPKTVNERFDESSKILCELMKELCVLKNGQYEVDARKLEAARSRAATAKESFPVE